MLYGIDVSHWNTIPKVKEYMQLHKVDFLIAKCTEGKNFNDLAFESWMKFCDDYDIRLKGAYHFYNSKTTSGYNAKNFLSKVKKYVDGNTLLVLDVEGNQCLHKKTWDDVLECCLIIYKETGVLPLVYTSGYYTKFMGDLLKNNVGLWVAHYNVEKPKTNMYKGKWALWQYSNLPIDQDKFNGNVEQYLKYCKPMK